MFTHVNPTFLYIKWGLVESSFHGLVIMMYDILLIVIMMYDILLIFVISDTMLDAFSSHGHVFLIINNGIKFHPNYPWV